MYQTKRYYNTENTDGQGKNKGGVGYMQEKKCTSFLIIPKLRDKILLTDCTCDLNDKISLI